MASTSSSKSSHSALAAAIVLHGGPTPEEFKAILAHFRGSEPRPEDYDFGPAYEMDKRRFHESYAVLKRFVKKL